MVMLFFLILYLLFCICRNFKFLDFIVIVMDEVFVLSEFFIIFFSVFVGFWIIFLVVMWLIIVLFSFFMVGIVVILEICFVNIFLCKK